MILFGYVILTFYTLFASDLVFGAPGDKAGSSTNKQPGSSWTGGGTKDIDSGGTILYPVSPGNDRPKEPTPSLACPGGQKFCQNPKAKEIVSQTLNDLPQSLLERFDSFFGSEAMILTRDDGDERPEYICESVVKTDYPDLAVAVDRKTRLIVNANGKYLQGVQTEVCKRTYDNKTLPCKFSSFANGYRTECEQKWAIRRMVTLDQYAKRKENALSTAEFKFPSCCACRVIPTTN